MKHYDLIVIGSGGGAKLIGPCARLGLKVAAIEKQALGGTCLNRGCIPSKMLIHPADLAMEIKGSGKFGLQMPGRLRVDFAALINRISQTVDGDSEKIAAGYAKNPNIDFYPFEARFLSDRVIEVHGEKMTADKIFIAVGARPFVPPIPGLKGTPFMTSTEALRNGNLPQKMIVLGGGFIAVELGHAYGALGTEVHFLVRRRLLSREDRQISDEFQRVFSQFHQVHLGVIPTRMEYDGEEFHVFFQDQHKKEHRLCADALLVANSIVPNTDALGLENTSIALNSDGFVLVNDFLETTAPDVYALGDCIGRYFYRHTVNYEGEYLFRTLFKEEIRKPLVYPPIPHAVFTHPQIASVGKTEDELKMDGVDYMVGLNPYQKSAMGMALLSDSGFVKLLFERSTRILLGAHIIGDEASNMIHMLIAFMYKKATLDDLLGMVYVHPALPEIVRNAARNAQAEFERAGKRD